jgi:hypothetical protein
VCCRCIWRGLILALPMVLVFVVSWIPLVLSLAVSCSVAECVTPWYVIIVRETFMSLRIDETLLTPR